MPLKQLDTENADRDLTSIVTVLTHTPNASKATFCQGLVYLGDGTKNLDGTGGDFELTITIGGQTIEPSPQVIEFSTAVRAAVWTTVFPVPANDEVILRVKSPNGADTDVDVTAYIYESTFALPDAAADAANGIVTGDGNVTLTAGVGNRPAVDVEAIDNETTSAFALGDWLEKGIRLTADSGTTTTLTDAGLDQADDYWNGSLLIFRTGTNSGRTAIVTDFDADSNTITFTPAVPDAVTTEGFALIPGLGHAGGITDASLQDIAQVVSARGGTVWYVSSSGDDSDGLTPATAYNNPKATIEAASAGDLVLIDGETFALGDNVINTPDGVSFRGAGMDVTTLTSTATLLGGTPKGAIVKPGSNSEIEDITVRGIATAGSFQAAFGTFESPGQTAFTNAVLRRCRGYAETDCLYIHHSSVCSLVVEDCLFESQVDTIVVGGNAATIVTCLRCVITSLSDNGLLTIARGTYVDGGLLRLQGCLISARDAVTTYGLSCTGGQIEAHQCTIRTSAAGGTILDVFESGSDGVTMIGCEYDRTKTSGTITDASNLYTADIHLDLDGNTQDEYRICWLKNGVRITSGITVPKIQVTKRADGTDLIALTAMTEIGSTGGYKYDERTKRITAGEAVEVIVFATIDGAARKFPRVIGRDRR